MNWTKLWTDIFGTTTILDLNVGFWVAMSIVVLIVIVMNIVFWSIKPKE